MKLRSIIFISLGLLALLFLAPMLGAYLYRPELRGLPGEYEEEKFELYADDASLLRGTLTWSKGPGTERGFVLFLADSELDRDWTAEGKGFAGGRILARRLGGLGFRSARFDQRGTGATVQSGRNYASPDVLARDARRVLLHFAGNFSDTEQAQNVFILAHGDGCAPALVLANRLDFPPTLILMACSLRGTLLDQWTERILLNMSRTGVSPANLAAARDRIQTWRVARAWTGEPIRRAPDPALPPDLQALDRALDEMVSERLLPFTREAENFDFRGERDRWLSKPGARLVHMLAEVDFVLPENEIEYAQKAAEELQRRTAGRARFVRLPRTDHFLSARANEPSAAVVVLLESLNPLRRVSPAVLGALDEVFGTGRSAP